MLALAVESTFLFEEALAGRRQPTKFKRDHGSGVRAT